LKKLLVLDSHALIHRSFYAVKSNLTLKNGTPINAVFGFARVLLQIIEKMDPDYFVVVKDLPGKTFRHEKFKEYKATRTKAPQELYDQIPVIYELLSAFHLPVLGKVGFEADDIAGTISRYSKIPDDVETFLITGDFDYLQLVNDKTTVIHFKKGFSEVREYDVEGVKKYYDLDISQVLDYKAIVGDSSDNLPGVRGVGPKGAAKLLQKFRTLDGIYEHIEEVQGKQKDLLIEYKDSAYLTRELSKIQCDVDVDFDFEDFKFDLGESLLDIQSIFNEFQFSVLQKKLDYLLRKNANVFGKVFEEKEVSNVSQGSLF